MKKDHFFVVAFIIFATTTLFSITINAQRIKEYDPPKGWREPELYIPATCLATAFIINEYSIRNNTMTEETRVSIAITGIATMAISHIILRNIRENKKRHKKRRKR